MSYPEPIPILRGKDAERMTYLLEHPKPLTEEQKEFYREARKRFPPSKSFESNYPQTE